MIAVAKKRPGTAVPLFVIETAISHTARSARSGIKADEGNVARTRSEKQRERGEKGKEREEEGQCAQKEQGKYGDWKVHGESRRD